MHASIRVVFLRGSICSCAWMSSKVELSLINPSWLFSLRRFLSMSHTLFLVHDQSLSCLFYMNCGYDASDCDSITSIGGARIYCLYLSRAYDDMRCCEGRVERSVLVRLRLNHRISFHVRRSIHSYKKLLALVFNVKAFDSYHLTSQMHV